MVQVFALVLALLFCGETITTLLEVPVPGAALALVALSIRLASRGGPDPEMERVFDAVAPNVPLLFVPAAVGVVANLELVAQFWLLFAVAVVLGTGVTLVIAGLCAQTLLRRMEQEATSCPH